MTDRSRKLGWLSQFQSLRAFVTLQLILVLASHSVLEQHALGQDSKPAAAEMRDAPADAVVVGIKGHYRLGMPTAVRFDPRDSSDVVTDSLTVETTDGDGVRVSTAGSLETKVSAAAEIAYIVPGSEGAPLEIKTTGENPSTLVSTRFPILGVPARGPALIPPNMPWIVSIGDPLGVQEIGASKLLERQSRIAVTEIDTASLLPHSEFGYSGVDLVMINASGLDVLEQMNQAQRVAIDRWLVRGGRMFVCLGEAAEQMRQAAPWITNHIPTEEYATTRLDPAALETFVTSQVPLDVFQGLRLPRRTGQILLSGRTTRRVTAVLAARYVAGLGRISIIAADLDADPFTQWPDRLKLVTQLNGEVFAEQNRDGRPENRGTSYNDLVGQMRSTLDQFDVKSRFSFSLVSLIVLLFVLAVGPIDYLVVNRVLGRPLLGWVTFPITAIALAAILVNQAKPRLEEQGPISAAKRQITSEADASLSERSLLRANQFQVVDLDLLSGAGRGFQWTCLYSHGPAMVDLDIVWSDELREAAESRSDVADITSVYPMGYPGASFGGIQLVGENTSLPRYEIDSLNQRSADQTEAIRGATGLTLAARSSKSIATQISFSVNQSGDAEVRRRPGSELLRGELINPLPFDLLDGMLVYQNWVYLLPTRLRAGDSIESIHELRQKNFRWRLSRQQAQEENKTKTTPWDPSDYGDLRRVSEMMLFHRAVGGELYTGLRHDVVGTLDLSHVLTSDRCMLVGRTETPLIRTEVTDRTGQDNEGFEPTGEKMSVVRIVMPVRATRLN